MAPGGGPADGGEPGSERGDSAAASGGHADAGSGRRLTHPGSRAIATVLATAAILAALITTRASILSSDGSGDWQTGLRDEVKRSAAVQEDVRYVYQNLLPLAMTIETARARIVALRQALVDHPESTARLQLEIGTQEQVVQNLTSASPLSSRTDLALPSGGWDLGKTLADQRNQTPDLVALDPDADVAAGDIAAAKARRVTLATIPIGLGVLFAALAEPFVSWRRRLVWVATGLVGLGIVTWAVVELLT
jgi:hypothetical protein